MLDWKGRCQYATHQGLFRHRIWTTRDDRYRLTESKWLGSSQYSTRYYACVKVNWGWDMISQHRTHNAALAAVEKRARQDARKERVAI